MRQLNVHMLPDLVSPHALTGKTVVVIDVLRATTTIATALHNGAAAIIPCVGIDEAKDLARQQREQGVKTLLAGERGGLPIEGFDLGNSPIEYDSSVVAGHLIVFTTTNGTKAMMQPADAGRLLLASFANLGATASAIANDPDLDIVCAGTDGEITREDVLLAGALVEQMTRTDATYRLSDQARLSIDAWRSLQANPKWELASALRETRGGENLIAIGHESDVQTAAEIDTISAVAELDLSNWRIRVGDARLLTGGK